MKRINRNIILKIIISLMLSIPVLILIKEKIQKYNGKIELVKKYTTSLRYLDINYDGLNDGLLLKNIEKDLFYTEVWGKDGLYGVASQKANMLKNSLLIDDINKDSIVDYAYLSVYNDTLFLIQNEISIVNRSLQHRLLKSVAITPIIIKEAQPEILKSEFLDIDNDGFKDYVFTIAHGIKHRAIYSYNFKKNILKETSNQFMFFTDFCSLKINSKNILLYTTYANANIPQSRLGAALQKIGQDTLLAGKCYSDNSAYLGFLNQNLVQVSKPLAKSGFTAMFRVNSIVINNQPHLVALETYLNQPDSLQTIRLLDLNLKTVKSVRLKLPYNTESYNKFNKVIFQQIKINGKERLLLAGRNDSIYELTQDLKLKHLFTDNNIPEGTIIKQMDITNDSIPEIVCFGPSGLTIFPNQLEDKLFIPSPVNINPSVHFDKTGIKEPKQGFYLITDSGNLLLFSFRYNPLFQYRFLFVLVSLIIFYVLLSFIIKVNTKKLERENKKLEFVVNKRTKELSEKNEALQVSNHVIKEKQKEILDSINYANRIQKALFTGEDLISNHFNDYFIFLKPKDIVSGDFYWATMHENYLYIAVCDSTGHGVPGAFMSLLNIGFLSEAINEKNILEPHLIFNYVRERLINSISKEGQKDGFDGILFCFNVLNNEITYAAANNLPILVSDNNLVELSKDRMPVSKGEKTNSFTMFRITKTANNILYLYTDGFADQFGGANGKKFKYKALNELLLTHSHLPMLEQKKKIESIFESWKGDLEQVDDVCIIGLKI